MPSAIDQYKQIQENIQQKKAVPTESQLAKAKYYGYTDEQVNQEMNKLQPNSATPVAPTPTPVAPVQPTTPETPVPATPPVAPAPIAPEVKTPEPKMIDTGYVNSAQGKLEQADLNKFNSNLSLYSTGKSLYDAVQ